MEVYKNFRCNWSDMGKKKKIQSTHFYWADNLQFFNYDIFSTQHHKNVCTVKYLILL